MTHTPCVSMYRWIWYTYLGVLRRHLRDPKLKNLQVATGQLGGLEQLPSLNDVIFHMRCNFCLPASILSVSKNRGGFSPKMDGENNGKSYQNGMIWGETQYFWKHPFVYIWAPWIFQWPISPYMVDDRKPFYMTSTQLGEVLLVAVNVPLGKFTSLFSFRWVAQLPTKRGSQVCPWLLQTKRTWLVDNLCAPFWTANDGWMIFDGPPNLGGQHIGKKHFVCFERLLGTPKKLGRRWEDIQFDLRKIPSLKLTWHLKIMVWKMIVLFNWVIFEVPCLFSGVYPIFMSHPYKLATSPISLSKPPLCQLGAICPAQCCCLWLWQLDPLEGCISMMCARGSWQSTRRNWWIPIQKPYFLGSSCSLLHFPLGFQPPLRHKWVVLI